MEPEQCEHCLGYTDKPMELICSECAEKLAGADMNKIRLSDCIKALQEIYNATWDIDYDKEEWPTDLARGYGIAKWASRFALKYCDALPEESPQKQAV